MTQRGRKTKQGFLNNYKLDDRYLLRPDRTKGRPGIYSGYSALGNPVLVKVWPRQGNTDDGELKDIWSHEIRQLHRLQGYPGAADCIAYLLDSGYDDKGFYLVLDPGQRQPLHQLLSLESGGYWLNNPKLPKNRLLIWKNIGLLAKGLETLHSQGLLHRNIDKWAVLTAGLDEPDFQLTGFEWSMRVVATDSGTRVQRRHKGGADHDSFLHDWRAFGVLAGELLGANQTRLKDTKLSPHEVADHLKSEEALLLRKILQITPSFPLNGETITSGIDQVCRILVTAVAGHESKYNLALRFGPNSKLSERIRECAGLEIDDVEGQRIFVEEDLALSSMLIAIRRNDRPDDITLALRGRNLIYRLTEFRPARSSQLSWDIAYCDGCLQQAPAPVNVAGTMPIPRGAIECMLFAEANKQFPRIRGRVASWNDLKKEFHAEISAPTKEEVTHKALALIQFIEALYAAAEVFPVEVIPQDQIESDVDSESVENTLHLKPRSDPDRNQLSIALGLRSLSNRLEQALDGDNIKPEGWILSDSTSLGETGQADTEWRFREISRTGSSQELYIFTGDHPAPLFKDAVLIPEGYIGRDVQFKRRLRALRALNEHHELLRMITDPRSRIADTHDIINEDDSFAELDGPKQEALKEIIATIPLYLVQGPPGVGKTRLVRDLVKRLFEDDSTSRLLLTAQSNAAVDHLLDELAAVLDDHYEIKPLIVRCVSKDKAEVSGEFDIGNKAKELISNLSKSELASELPKKLSDSLNKLSGISLDDSPKTLSGRTINQAYRAFEGVVARAANVVFATTNSSELDRLIDERGQFDWAIVEEAGKATGSELVTPMLLSHRRLMIGDHKQLPPFDIDKFIALLKEPESVKNALTLGNDFIGRPLRDSTTEEVLDEIDSESDEGGQVFTDICTTALRVLTLFETIIEDEFSRQKRPNARGRPIAKKLTDQHRMHPAIASLVSKVFYQNDLDTHASCIEKFKERRPPYSSLDKSILPVSPIVIVNMPYVQSTINVRRGDTYPRWHNPLEVEAAITILENLSASGLGSDAPTLAILSPYNQQVRRIRNAIDGSSSAKNTLSSFRAPTHDGEFCHTVDSFQGSEADVVIVSLVRNNSHSNPQSALGFLQDMRRMNVLLSRAKWQLVLITSLDFLNEILQTSSSTGPGNISFLKDMLEYIEGGKESGLISVVSPRIETGKS